MQSRTRNLLAVTLLLGALSHSHTLARRVQGAERQAPKPERPNVIFLLTDDQRWDTLGCMGNSIIRTPNVDRLAAQGVVFDRCFVTTSICMTNRACIFTGQYAARHGVWDFRTTFTPEQLDQTYPALLKQAGYYVGFIGKWGVGKPPEGLFDYNQGWPGQNRYYEKAGGESPFAYLTPGPEQQRRVAE
jgi:arylsulfatase A-like enzyme